MSKARALQAITGCRGGLHLGHMKLHKEEAKTRHTAPNFMEILILAAWHIWKQRNRLIFDNVQPTLQSWWQEFQLEVKLQVHRANAVARDNILTWLDSLQDPAS